MPGEPWPAETAGMEQQHDTTTATTATTATTFLAGWPPRPRSNRRVAGVAAGLAHRARIDPLVLRVVVVVLTIFGGTGLLLYGGAWLLMPDEAQPRSPLQLVATGRLDGSVLAPAVLALLGLAVVGGSVGAGLDGSGLIVAAVLGLTALLVVSSRDQLAARPGAATPAPTGPPPPPGAYGQTAGVAYSGLSASPAGPTGGATAYAPPFVPPPPPPPRERSVLGGVIVSLTVLVVGGVLAWDAATGAGLGWRVALAWGLVVLGLGLLVGTWWGRARSVSAVAVLTTLVLLSTVSYGVPLRGGVGERVWEPTSVAQVRPSYELAAGLLVLDLRSLDVPAGTTVAVEATVAAGTVLVQLPGDVGVRVRGEAGLGEVDLPGQPVGSGTGPGSRTVSGGLGVEASTVSRPRAARAETVDLDLSVGVGTVEVRRAAS